MKKLLFTTVALLVATISGSASAITIGGGAGGWNQSISGWIEYKGSNPSFNTQVDIEKDLHLEGGTKAFGWFTVELPLLPDVRVQYTKMEFSGEGTVEESFSFGDIDVNKSERVESNLKVDQMDVALYYGVPFLGLLSGGKVNVKGGVNVKIINTHVEVKTTSDKEEKDATIPVPMVYLWARVKPIPLLSAELMGSWIGFSGSQFYEVMAEVKLHPAPLFFIGTGYRYQKLKIDDIFDISSDLEVKGLFAEAGLLF